MGRTIGLIASTLLSIAVFAGGLEAQNTSSDKDRIAKLEKRIESLEKDQDEVSMANELILDFAEGMKNFSFGGYGEIHANFGESHSKDTIDLHRFVIYIGYEFTDWITLHSETEIEHGFVSDGDGDVVIEQLAVDFALHDLINVRAGRVLSPMGLINKRHEPTSFNGVERPDFAKYLIPSTWSVDGIGIYGDLSDSLTYEVYAVGSLDGSGFSATDGIRGGRIKERPSLNEVAVTGRVDFRPFAAIEDSPESQSLRFGFSSFFGGLDNGNNGNNPGNNGELFMNAIDAEYSIGALDLRGAAAHSAVTGSRSLGAGTAKEMFGYFVEAAVHVMPESCKTGRLKNSDLVVFARFDKINNQYKRITGAAKNDSGDREITTIGFSWFFTPKVVAKFDVQLRNDANPGDQDSLVNIGIGWTF